MTQTTAMSAGVKTAYLLGHVGSDYLEVTSFQTWSAAPPLCPAAPPLCPACLLCNACPLGPMCLDKEQLRPTVCHTALSMSILSVLASTSPSCSLSNMECKDPHLCSWSMQTPLLSL